MAGSMSKADLSHDLKSMLGKSVEHFKKDGLNDFIRLLNMAARALSRDKPLQKSDTLSLIAGQFDYEIPADLVKPMYSDWGKQETKTRLPWNSNYPDRLPTLKLIIVPAGKKLRLTPAPTAAQIADLGAEYIYYYSAKHEINSQAALTTVDDSDRDLLLLRALAFAMTDLAASSSSLPVQLGPSKYSSTPKNGTPSALAESFLKQYEAML